MKTNKGFTTIVAIIIGLLVIGGGAYLYTNSNNNSGDVDTQMEDNILNQDDTVTQEEPTVSEIQNTPTQPQGASYVEEENRIKVVSPKLNDVVTIGETVVIKWNNYSGNQNIIIGLQATKPDGSVEVKNVASNIPNTGSYAWVVTSENTDYDYKIEIHPLGGRELVGRSETFNIEGEPLVKNVSLEDNSFVDASEPIIVTGMAKNIYFEADFPITASYVLDGEEVVIGTFNATCNLDGDGCNWISNDYLEFESELDLSSSPVCGVNIKFYGAGGIGVDHSTSQQPEYELPVMLYGIDGCVEN